jgi:hypothetical protein
MASVGSDDTYTIEEIALVTGISVSTMYRWRWTGRLLTRYDFEIDPDLMKRLVVQLRNPANAGKPLPGAMPAIRFFLEDATRMLVIGHLGAMGWDRTKLFEVLAWPYAIYIERGREPRCLAIFPNGTKLDRLVFSSEQELVPPGETETIQDVLARKPWVVRIDLDSYREQMLKSLAAITEVRDKRAAVRASRPREPGGRFLPLEKEKV